jgi:hypothetical protein
MKEITLKEFLRHHKADRGLFIFAKDLTLEQFLNTCENGDWILWLFARTNIISTKEFELANAHCANTLRHLMTDERSKKAIDIAIAFGEGRATYEELENAGKAAGDANGAFDLFKAAFCARVIASNPIHLEDANCEFGRIAAYAAFAASAASAAWAAYDAAKKQNENLTADICRKYLPIEIWDQNLI